MGERWPGVYGEEDLRKHIHELSRREFLEESFYEWRSSANLHPPDDLCQGDVVRIHADMPLIDADGEPAAEEHESGFWMVLGNSCDFERRLDDVKHTQLVPVERRMDDLNAVELTTLRAYTQFRRFYLPDWRFGVPPELIEAEFSMPVT
ncbi:MAG: hypothetical protein AB7K71_32490, partial [Polyangiaceae bacterium]